MAYSEKLVYLTSRTGLEKDLVASFSGRSRKEIGVRLRRLIVAGFYVLAQRIERSPDVLFKINPEIARVRRGDRGVHVYRILIPGGDEEWARILAILPRGRFGSIVLRNLALAGFQGEKKIERVLERMGKAEPTGKEEKGGAPPPEETPPSVSGGSSAKVLDVAEVRSKLKGLM